MSLQMTGLVLSPGVCVCVYESSILCHAWEKTLENWSQTQQSSEEDNTSALHAQQNFKKYFSLLIFKSGPESAKFYACITIWMILLKYSISSCTFLEEFFNHFTD